MSMDYFKLNKKIKCFNFFLFSKKKKNITMHILWFFFFLSVFLYKRCGYEFGDQQNGAIDREIKAKA